MAGTGIGGASEREREDLHPSMRSRCGGALASPAFAAVRPSGLVSGRRGSQGGSVAVVPAPLTQLAFSGRSAAEASKGL